MVDGFQPRDVRGRPQFDRLEPRHTQALTGAALDEGVAHVPNAQIAAAEASGAGPEWTLAPACSAARQAAEVSATFKPMSATPLPCLSRNDAPGWSRASGWVTTSTIRPCWRAMEKWSLPEVSEPRVAAGRNPYFWEK
ncbi:hypothetical protein Srufu_062500 [Streptomyces libani subsp. rufus]|nr:hypothetical protein Srufu_062500 [Streptomyces libani subsp. rufus]